MVFRRNVFSWCMYDWANSAFAVVVLTAFFPVLFKVFWDSGVDASLNTARLGMGNTIAGLLVAVLSPVLGAIADAGKAKKAFLVFFMLVGTAMTGALSFAGQGAWGFALFLFVLANIGFSCGNLFYDSLLIDISEKDEMDFVSSLGYATGYVGGGLLILVDALCVLHWERLGLRSQQQAMLISFLSVALWWLVFSVPLMLFVKERRNGAARRSRAVVAEGMKRLKTTWRKIAGDRLCVLFIVAFWLYMDGVYTVIAMAVNFGMSIGLKPGFLIMTIVIVQFVAFPAAVGFGYVARMIGSGKTILAGIAVYVVVCTVGFFFLETGTHYVVLACVVAMAQGGVQALSRSYFAKIVPAEDSAEYFGFLNLISRFSIFFGPMLVGGVTYLCHRAGAAEAFSSRVGMSAITFVFIAGGALLILAEKERKRRLNAA